MARVERTAEAPREGLPPCIKLASFDDRAAIHHERCGDTPFNTHRYLVRWGSPDRWDKSPNHGGAVLPWSPLDLATTMATNDPAEAEAAWERAERWVRTGVLDG